MPTSNRTVGITLVVIGLLILLGQMGVAFLGWIWPVLLGVIGAGLLWSWYTQGHDSSKVFGGVLLVLLALFFLFMRREHVDMFRHWPFFVLAPGIALLVMARVDRSRRDASVPGWIAIGAALVLYFFTSGLFAGLMGFIFGLIGLVLRLLVPLALIGLGGWIIMNYRQGGADAAAGPVPEKYEPRPPMPAEEPEAGDDDDDPDDDWRPDPDEPGDAEYEDVSDQYPPEAEYRDDEDDDEEENGRW